MEVIVRTPAILEARGVCMLSSVASAMAKNSAMAGSASLHLPTFKNLSSRYTAWLLEEARNGHLILCDSAGVPCTWSELTEQCDAICLDVHRLWVTIHHLNAWGVNHGKHFTTTSENVPWFDERGLRGGAFTSSIDVQDQDGKVTHLQPSPTLLDALDKPSHQGPRPLTSAEISSSFQGLLYRTAEEWQRFLANKPNWLKSSNISRGTQGGPGATWHPVHFGAELINRKQIRVASVRARFQTSPHLQEWLEHWMEYQNNWFPTET